MTGGDGESDVTFEGNFYTKYEGLVRFLTVTTVAVGSFSSATFNRAEHCPVIIKFLLSHQRPATEQRGFFVSRSYFLLNFT